MNVWDTKYCLITGIAKIAKNCVFKVVFKRKRDLYELQDLVIHINKKPGKINLWRGLLKEEEAT